MSLIKSVSLLVFLDDGTTEGITFDPEEWGFLKFLIEDGTNFHKAMFEDFKEDDDLSHELGIDEMKARFMRFNEVLVKLQRLGLNVPEFENIKEQKSSLA